MDLRVIGTVRSAVRKRSEMPRQGAPARVELLPDPGGRCRNRYGGTERIEVAAPAAAEAMPLAGIG